MEALWCECACDRPARAGAGEFPGDGVLAHRHALQHDCWVLMEDGALMLGLRHLAECVHGPETRRAHLDPLDGPVHTFRILASTWCSMVMLCDE